MRRRREESKTMRSRRKKWRRETCKEERLIERRYEKEGERIVVMVLVEISRVFVA